MDTVDHQAMGYDRAITMFSPDGRLLQVEYAKKTVKQGIDAVGVACSDGVVIIADKRIIDKLMVENSVEKIFHIDDHIAATVTGFVSDGRVLIERAQIRAQQNRVSYGSPVDIIDVVKDICDLKQICAQSGGLRPFGVSILFAGIDHDAPRIVVTEPSGIYFEYHATAIGQNSDEIVDILNKEYKASMTMKQGAQMAIRALKKVLGDNFGIDRVEGASISIAEKTIAKYSKDDLKKMI